MTRVTVLNHKFIAGLAPRDAGIRDEDTMSGPIPRLSVRPTCVVHTLEAALGASYENSDVHLAPYAPVGMPPGSISHRVKREFPRLYERVLGGAPAMSVAFVDVDFEDHAAGWGGWPHVDPLAWGAAVRWAHAEPLLRGSVLYMSRGGFKIARPFDRELELPRKAEPHSELRRRLLAFHAAIELSWRIYTDALGSAGSDLPKVVDLSAPRDVYRLYRAPHVRRDGVFRRVPIVVVGPAVVPIPWPDPVPAPDGASRPKHRTRSDSVPVHTAFDLISYEDLPAWAHRFVDEAALELKKTPATCPWHDLRFALAGDVAYYASKRRDPRFEGMLENLVASMVLAAFARSGGDCSEGPAKTAHGIREALRKLRDGDAPNFRGVLRDRWAPLAAVTSKHFGLTRSDRAVKALAQEPETGLPVIDLARERLGREARAFVEGREQVLEMSVATGIGKTRTYIEIAGQLATQGKTSLALFPRNALAAEKQDEAESLGIATVRHRASYSRESDTEAAQCPFAEVMPRLAGLGYTPRVLLARLMGHSCDGCSKPRRVFVGAEPSVHMSNYAMYPLMGEPESPFVFVDDPPAVHEDLRLDRLELERLLSFVSCLDQTYGEAVGTIIEGLRRLLISGPEPCVNIPTSDLAPRLNHAVSGDLDRLLFDAHRRCIDPITGEHLVPIDLDRMIRILRRNRVRQAVEELQAIEKWELIRAVLTEARTGWWSFTGGSEPAIALLCLGRWVDRLGAHIRAGGRVMLGSATLGVTAPALARAVGKDYPTPQRLLIEAQDLAAVERLHVHTTELSRGKICPASIPRAPDDKLKSEIAVIFGEAARQARGGRVLVVTHMPLALALSPGDVLRDQRWVDRFGDLRQLESLRDAYRPLLAPLEPGVDVTHYGAIQGTNAFTGVSGIVTLGDPYPPLEHANRIGQWLGADDPGGWGVQRLAASEELTQAHGRGRSVCSADQRFAIHAGRERPGGALWADPKTASARQLLVARARAAGMDSVELAEAVRILGSQSAVARAAGVGQPLVSRVLSRQRPALGPEAASRLRRVLEGL